MISLRNDLQAKFNHLRSSKWLQLGLVGFVGYVFLLGLWFNSQMANATALEIEGKQIALVKDEAEAQKLIAQITKEQETKLGQPVELKSEVHFKPIKAKEVLEAKELSRLLSTKLIFTTDATGISVDGKVKAVVQNDKTANSVIDSLKEVDLEKVKNVEIESVKFEENIKLVKVEKELKDITSKDKAIELLKYTNIDKVKVHVVAEGESLWTIADKYSLSVDELIAANPNLTPETLQIGKSLNINQAEALVNVLVTAKAKSVEEVPFKTEITKDYDLPRGKEKVKQEGTKGKIENTYTIVFRNNIPVEKQLVEAKTIEEAKPKIVLRGAKSITVASRGGSAASSWSGGGGGSFGWPTKGRITATLGDGRGHTGIDIANRVGTGIYAAKSGVVIQASYSGSYGNVVVIDHGDGYFTRYAHASSILVSVGQRVNRGQLIEYMGSTGRSTGPHLHFEIRRGGKNGTVLNPLNFLR